METSFATEPFISSYVRTNTVCPTCGQKMPIEYKRKLNSYMAVNLIKLLKKHRELPNFKGEWVHITQLNLNGGDFAKLRYWGLIREQENTLIEKKNAGFWKITPKGLDFLNDRVRVPAYVYLKNNEVQSFSESTVNIHEALGKHFSYYDLMKGYGG